MPPIVSMHPVANRSARWQEERLVNIGQQRIQTTSVNDKESIDLFSNHPLSSQRRRFMLIKGVFPITGNVKFAKSSRKFWNIKRCVRKTFVNRRIIFHRYYFLETVD